MSKKKQSPQRVAKSPMLPLTDAQFDKWRVDFVAKLDKLYGRFWKNVSQWLEANKATIAALSEMQAGFIASDLAMRKGLTLTQFERFRLFAKGDMPEYIYKAGESGISTRVWSAMPEKDREFLRNPQALIMVSRHNSRIQIPANCVVTTEWKRIIDTRRPEGGILPLEERGKPAFEGWVLIDIENLDGNELVLVSSNSASELRRARTTRNKLQELLAKALS
jgi:hypothetical protein